MIFCDTLSEASTQHQIPIKLKV